MNYNNNRPHCGICGTGVISGVAQFCHNRIIDPGGAFDKSGHIKSIQKDDTGLLRYVLVPENVLQESSAVYISQKDIRSVQLGKAALITGIEFLLMASGYEKPEKIIIAGTFGTFIEKEDMITLGMIPDMDSDVIEVAGNSAGAGAAMVICDAGLLDKAIEMADRITNVELACDPKFQEVFVQMLRFPFAES